MVQSFQRVIRQRVRAFSSRRWVLIVSSTLTISFVLAACGVAGVGGSENTEPTPTETPDWWIATFTPVPPDYTPEALQTRAAQQTAWSQTATAAPPTTATPPPPVATQQSNRPTPAPGEIRPPDLILAATGGQVIGDAGSFNFCSEESNTCADVQAPWVALSGNGVSWATGTPARFTVPSTPYAVQSADVSVYPYDGNVVIPTDGQGNVSDKYAFIAQTPPADRQSIPGPDLLLNSNLTPGFYIIEMRVNWVTPEGVARPMFTQYVFVVEVV